jgi:adenosylmethionine-8-amino-7-oxononanoate aminotransferase
MSTPIRQAMPLPLLMARYCRLDRRASTAQTIMTHILHRQIGHTYPVAASAQGVVIRDSAGKEYIDASGGAAVSCLGHAHPDVLAAMRAQLDRLAYAHTSFFTSEPAEELADDLAAHAPPGIGHVFYVSGGSEAIEAALKLARQYFVERGEPQRRYLIARRQSYHGITLGALAIGGRERQRHDFAPLLIETHHVSPVYDYRERRAGETPEAYGERLAAELEAKVRDLGEDSVIAFVAETVVGATLGAVPAVPGYFRRVREICDRYGILLCFDEVITGFGRLGEWFASERFGVTPDLITSAKGLSSAYASIGALVASDRVMEPFLDSGRMYLHGMTFGGHPVQAAIALKNIEIMRREGIVEHVRESEDDFRATLEPLLDLPIVGDLRGTGFFYALELVKDKESRATFSDAECDELLRGFMSPRLFEEGLICRADDRGDPVIQISPPLVAGQEQFDEIAQTLGTVLREAGERMQVAA